jgi:hypothetical protein
VADIHRNELLEEALRKSRLNREMPSPDPSRRKLLVALAAAAPVIILVLWLSVFV